jgi:hypothetical protein
MLSTELMQQFSEMQDFWSSDLASDSVLEEFVLKNLAGVSASEYELSKVLREKVVEMLLRNGQQQLQHEGRGGVRMISSGRVVDLSYLAPMYRVLFENWQERQWIRIESDLTVTKGA